MASPEILAVLADEINAARAPMAAALADLAAAVDSTTRAEAAERYLEEMRRVGAAAEVLGLEGVAGLHAVIERNTQALLDHPELVPTVQIFYEKLPQLLCDYLSAPRDITTAHTLAFAFTDAQSPAQISLDLAEALQAMLLDVSLEEGADRRPE